MRFFVSLLLSRLAKVLDERKSGADDVADVFLWQEACSKTLWPISQDSRLRAKNSLSKYLFSSSRVKMLRGFGTPGVEMIVFSSEVIYFR